MLVHKAHMILVVVPVATVLCSNALYIDLSFYVFQFWHCLRHSCLLCRALVSSFVSFLHGLHVSMHCTSSQPFFRLC
jgi:hypothetical protein